MRDKDPQNDWIPLLQTSNGRCSIADVLIRDPHHPIVDQNEQNRITLALLKLTINVKYEVPIPEGAEERLKQKFPDKEDSWIQKQLSRKHGLMVSLFHLLFYNLNNDIINGSLWKPLSFS